MSPRSFCDNKSTALLIAEFKWRDTHNKNPDRRGPGNPKEVGMVCSQCEWYEKVKLGEFKDVPWDDVPCSRCELKEFSNHTIEYKENIGADDDDGDDAKVPGRINPGGPRRPDVQEAEVKLPVSLLADTLRLFLALPRDALDVLHMRYGGLPYKDIGEKLGVTSAAVEVRHKRLLAEIPALKELYPRKAKKADARRQRRRRAR